MVQGVALQGEGGDQSELVGELLVGLGIGAQFQNNGVLGLADELVLAEAGKAVLAGGIGLALGLEDAAGDLAGMGEEDGRVVAPDGCVSLPDVLDAVALADQALDLCAPGGDRQLQILVFNGVFHGSSSV